jgi:hypothetical protein
MINTMTGSPEMQPLTTVLAAALGVCEPAGRHVATLGYQRGGRTGPTGTESTTMATRHLVERLLRSASRSDPSIGRAGHPSALTVRMIARGDLDMSRLPDKIILR